MTPLTDLWLPILVSAAIVFVASSILHMVLPWHRSDYRKLPNEDKFMETVRPLAIQPGDYMVPCPGSREAMRSSEFMEKFKKGPVMMMTILPGGSMSMGRNLVLWFLYLIVVSFFSAYVAGAALRRYAEYLEVFRFAGVAAFLSYSVAMWPMSIWYRRSWVTTIKATIDGLIYAGLTAGVFGWLWPR
ncbi:MAG TPA: hypothetical protein VI636_19210 [Candidatus Angelobacter sp.]